MANTTINLPAALFSFGHLAKPHAWAEGDEPKFDITVCWPVAEYEANGPEWLAVKNLIVETAVGKWGDRAKVKRDGGPPYRLPFRYGSDNEKNPERFKDYVLCTLRSKFEIPIVEARAQGDPEQIHPDKLRKGMKVVVQAKPNAWSVGGNKGVSLWPVAVCVVDTTIDLAFNEATDSETEYDPAAKAKEAVSHFAGVQAVSPVRTVTNPDNPPVPSTSATDEGPGF